MLPFAITGCLFIFNWIESHQQEVVMILHIQILIKHQIPSDSVQREMGSCDFAYRHQSVQDDGVRVLE